MAHADGFHWGGADFGTHVKPFGISIMVSCAWAPHFATRPHPRYLASISEVILNEYTPVRAHRHLNPEHCAPNKNKQRLGLSTIRYSVKRYREMVNVYGSIIVYQYFAFELTILRLRHNELAYLAVYSTNAFCR